LPAPCWRFEVANHLDEVIDGTSEFFTRAPDLFKNLSAASVSILDRPRLRGDCDDAEAAALAFVEGLANCAATRSFNLRILDTKAPAITCAANCTVNVGRCGISIG
jgi:hypothetical protein